MPLTGTRKKGGVGMRFAPAAAIALSLLLGAPAFAQDDRRGGDLFPGLESQMWLQGAIREGDVALLLDYLRAAMLAAAEGREPPPPPEKLERRAEELGAELKARGTLAALLLLSALEGKAKALLRERAPPPRRALPPSVPYTPVSAD
jgi:hypothetical protein